MNTPAKKIFAYWPRGLFWRVFITIVIAVAISAFTTFGLFHVSAERHLERVFAQDYTGLSDQIKQALDDDKLIELQSEFKEEKHATLVVFEGRQPLGTRPRPWLADKLTRNNSNKRKGKERERDRDQNRDRDARDFELMQTRLHHKGREYRVIIVPNTSDIREVARPLGILSFIAMLVIASSTIAWMFSRPLREVQSAARLLSTGDTTARVSAKVARRNDSIGELGSDFNHMAGRIQLLLDAQQQLLRDVSHELRTPLARMQVALVLAQDNPGSSIKHLDRMETEIERLDDLIGNILSLSKVESGTTQLEESEFELCELIEQVAQDAEFEYSSKGTKVSIDCAITHLYGDRDRLHSAMENIVRNAMRYSKTDGTVNMSVTTRSNDTTITIRDHGPGVSEDQLSSLFKAFYRTESARSAEKTGGHGVGLAIARSIVSLHGGTIVARNAQGGGLEISIKLPATRQR